MELAILKNNLNRWDVRIIMIKMEKLEMRSFIKIIYQSAKKQTKLNPQYSKKKIIDQYQ